MFCLVTGFDDADASPYFTVQTSFLPADPVCLGVSLPASGHRTSEAPFHDIDQRPPASGGNSSEAAVSKGNAVEADGETQPGYGVEDTADHDVVPAQSPAPGQRDGREQREERDTDEDRDQNPRAGPLGFWIEIVRRYLAGARSRAYVPGRR
jgi:hypothetical protein